jgi:hypothetical protein
MNINDLSAQIETENANGQLIIKTQSKLVDKNQQNPASGLLNCRIAYQFTDKKITIKFHFDKSVHDGQVKIILPVISKSTEKFTLADKLIRINKGASTLQISSSSKLTLLPTTTKNRIFNFVPGLEAIPLSIDQNETTIVIEVI